LRTLIIAEAGVNHNGDMVLARKLIDVAAASGVDMIKCQTFSADKLVTAQACKADYQKHTSSSDESQYKMLHRLELNREMHEELIAYCELRRIQFHSTGFDVESVDMLLNLGINTFKIPSGEIANLPYLRYIGRHGLSTIISTGMADLGEVEKALDVLEKAGTSRKLITVLHCNTEYPTPMADVNLRAMLTIRDAFGVAVGYSDHTLGIEVPIAAVALGATVIEKHFTLDRNLPGPDHNASLEPDELKAMVAAIRNIEQALGDGIKRLTSSEAKNKLLVRKSLVASHAIKMGDIFSAQNVTTKRPGTGISPMRWDEIMGRAAPRDFEADELIEFLA